MQIILNPEEKKKLSFKFEIEGLNESLNARLILPMKDGMKLVCESPIIDGNVDLDIPILKEFQKNILTDGVMVEVVSETQRFETWTGQIEFVQKPKVKVESIKTEETSKGKEKIKMTEMVSKEQEIVEEKPKTSTKDALKAALK